ncbi:30S ribosomal protein S17 [Candidatus Hodgkinia cicadicola]|nr:30S ribosomal protein S17 [Candidatus Hodgkinia cicadicola]
MCALSAQKTKTALVIRRIKHSRYRKLIKRKKKFLVHDASGNHKLSELARHIPSASAEWFVSARAIQVQTVAKTDDSSDVRCTRCVEVLGAKSELIKVSAVDVLADRNARRVRC